MAVFATSSQVPPERYDVFISFRGSDVRHGFLSHLTKKLQQEGIDVYVDEMLERGDEISSGLLKAIERSKIALVIFSKDYASSRWCLEELVKIKECKGVNNQIVIPIFYNVEPSHVRNQKGSYADAFAQHEQNFKDDLMKLQNWRSILKEIANISGYNSSNFLNESDLIDEIIKDVSKNRVMKKYDVFISFRGPKIRYGFLSHLTKQLQQKRIHVYVDERLERRDEISTLLQETIERSTIVLVILSKNYASSRWCLEELVKIMECKRVNKQIVIPIFYHVDPSCVRNQKGSCAKAFVRHEEKFKDYLMNLQDRKKFQDDLMTKLQDWKSALKEVASLSGYLSSNYHNEPDLIDGIIKDVYKKLEDKGNLRQSAS